MKSLSIVIPVYNSCNNLEFLYNRITYSIKNLFDCYEIILVDDASTDTSFEIITKISNSDHKVIPLRLHKNIGQQNATMHGLLHAKSDYIVTMDDDLQNPPEEIIKLIQKLETGYDVVYGIPENKRHGKYRNLGTKMTDCFFNIVFKKNPAIKISSFRVMNKKLVKRIMSNTHEFIYISALIFQCTNKIANVSVKHKQRCLGKSNYNIIKLLKLYWKLIKTYSKIGSIFTKQ